MGLSRELEGMLVVSLDQAVAAPYCGLLLANSGARVIKVERPEGDFARGYDTGAEGQSSIFAWLNRGKQSVCLDLKAGDDMQVMRAMLAQSDVFLSNLAPGAVDRLGLDHESLAAVNPGLISCTITGYGPSEAAAHKKAYDFLVQAESGVCAVTGSPEAPARVGVSLTDLSTGLTAYSTILRALIQRGRTGRGTAVSVSMFDVMADWMNMPLMAHRYMGGAPARSGLQHSFVAPYGAFDCAGGAQVLLSIQNNREWAAFCNDVLGQPELTDDPRFKDNPDRYANRTALDAVINASFGTQSAEAVIARLDAAQIANAALNSVADVSDHPLLRNTGARIGGVDIEVAGLPVPDAAGEPVAVPDLGADTMRIKQEFGTSS
ncbi:MAG: CoA transferase [Rhodobacteraceae bacterium]|nr:CoA transferase [Paracoccaceae bacterium]